MVPVTDEAAVATHKPAPYERTPKGETVLVVEDEMALRAVTERIFARNGYHVLTAANGADALALVARYEGEIHLLVTDVVMPKMLGKEVAAAGPSARARTSRCCSCPATPSPSWPPRDRLEPGVALLDKPFSEADLLAKAGQVLDGHFKGYATVGGPSELQDVVAGVGVRRDLGVLGGNGAQPTSLEVLESRRTSAWVFITNGPLMAIGRESAGHPGPRLQAGCAPGAGRGRGHCVAGPNTATARC